MVRRLKGSEMKGVLSKKLNRKRPRGRLRQRLVLVLKDLQTTDDTDRIMQKIENDGEACGRQRRPSKYCNLLKKMRKTSYELKIIPIT